MHNSFGFSSPEHDGISGGVSMYHQMEWKDSELVSAEFSDKKGTVGSFKYQGVVAEFEIQENGIYTVNL